MLLMPEEREVKTAHWQSLLRYHFDKKFYKFVDVFPINFGRRISNIGFISKMSARIFVVSFPQVFT